MKIQILRNEHGKHGYPQYVIVAEVDYPVDHKWTDIEKQVTDRVVVKQGDIELEWNCSVDSARVNRIFLYWTGTSSYFYVNNETRCALDEILPLSQHIFDELKVLDPFRLTVTSTRCGQIPKHIKKKVKQVIVDVTNKILKQEVVWSK